MLFIRNFGGRVQDFLAAGRFTAADISVGYALLLARHLGLDARFTPQVGRYRERAALAQGVSTVHAPGLRPFAQPMNAGGDPDKRT